MSPAASARSHNWQNTSTCWASLRAIQEILRSSSRVLGHGSNFALTLPSVARSGPAPARRTGGQARPWTRAESDYRLGCRVVLLMEDSDRSVVEAASWRLASELVRRHPTVLRLVRGHPGGGQSDCLWLLPLFGDQGDVRLNRVGTIQVLERFDGRTADGWQPTEWSEYLFAEPRGFLYRLEREAGLPTPSQAPSSTPRTLTYRVLAAITATAFKSVHPIEIQQGYIDSSGFAMSHDEPRDLGRPPPGRSTTGAGALSDHGRDRPGGRHDLPEFDPHQSWSGAVSACAIDLSWTASGWLRRCRRQHQFDVGPRCHVRRDRTATSPGRRRRARCPATP